MGVAVSQDMVFILEAFPYVSQTFAYFVKSVSLCLEAFPFLESFPCVSEAFPFV